MENTRNLVEFLQELLSCVSSWYLSDNLAYNVEQQALELVSPWCFTCLLKFTLIKSQCVKSFCVFTGKLNHFPLITFSGSTFPLCYISKTPSACSLYVNILFMYAQQIIAWCYAEYILRFDWSIFCLNFLKRSMSSVLSWVLFRSWYESNCLKCVFQQKKLQIQVSFL